MHEKIVDHINKHLGPPLENAIMEIVGTIKILVIPNSSSGYITLVTSGMSDSSMAAPEGAENYRHAEVFMHLPADWPLDKDSWEDPNYYWPIEWLRLIAHYPEADDVFFASQQTIGNEEPVAPNTKLSSLLFLESPDEFGQLQLDDKLIRFYQLFPLYDEEREVMSVDGLGRLFELFQENGISQVIDPNRLNVARS